MPLRVQLQFYQTIERSRENDRSALGRSLSAMTLSASYPDGLGRLLRCWTHRLGTAELRFAHSLLYGARQLGSPKRLGQENKIFGEILGDICETRNDERWQVPAD